MGPPTNFSTFKQRPVKERKVAAMKSLNNSRTVIIPKGVDVFVHARRVTVKGPRGKLVRSFKHLQCEITKQGSKRLTVQVWFGARKDTAVIRTVCSHIENMITGVTKGFEYKMRFVYAHFPISVAITNGAKKVEIRNFLGEKVVRVVDCLEGVSVVRSADVKDEIVLSGNDID